MESGLLRAHTVGSLPLGGGSQGRQARNPLVAVLQALNTRMVTEAGRRQSARPPNLAHNGGLPELRPRARISSNRSFSSCRACLRSLAHSRLQHMNSRSLPSRLAWDSPVVTIAGMVLSTSARTTGIILPSWLLRPVPCLAFTPRPKTSELSGICLPHQAQIDMTNALFRPSALQYSRSPSRRFDTN
jgi:hypothetical protein